VITDIGYATTQNANRYIQQLCKHWSHKFQVEASELAGKIHFSDDVTIDLSAQRDRIEVLIHTAIESQIVTLRAVIANHINRFAFREAPLTFVWERDAF
jgi:uncharacterized protein